MKTTALYLRVMTNKRLTNWRSCLQFVKLWVVELIDIMLIVFDIWQVFSFFVSFFVLGDTLENDCLRLLELRLGLGLEQSLPHPRPPDLCQHGVAIFKKLWGGHRVVEIPQSHPINVPIPPIHQSSGTHRVSDFWVERHFPRRWPPIFVWGQVEIPPESAPEHPPSHLPSSHPPTHPLFIVNESRFVLKLRNINNST